MQKTVKVYFDNGSKQIKTETIQYLTVATSGIVSGLDNNNNPFTLAKQYKYTEQLADQLSEKFWVDVY